jgi:hypothetical protein
MYVHTDFVMNGAGHGELGMRVRGEMGGMRWEAGLDRPYIDRNGRPAVTINMGRTTLVKGEQVPIKEHVLIQRLVNNFGIMNPVFNATSLRKEQWIELDRVILKAARFRLRAWADLAAANSYGGFNGMSKTILEHENMSDPGEAMVDMDGLTEGRNDYPIFGGQGLPLPITHSDFWFSSRKLSISQGSTPLDTVMGEASGRRIGEMIEKTTIGVTTGIIYGGANTALTYTNTPQVYGYINFPQRLTKTNITAPTAGGWVPQTTLNDVLTALDQLKANKFYGPFMVYTTNDWDKYLDNDYYVAITSGAVAPTKTLRERLRAIEGIVDVRRLDMWFGTQLSNTTGPGTDVDVTLKPYSLLFIQQTPDVARAVNGMDITTLQWPSVGGMRLNFKCMAIQVPQLRADQYGNCGILQATTS